MEHVAKRRNAHPAPAKWMVAGGIDPSVSGIDPRELGRGTTINGSGCVCCPVESRIVAHDHDPVRRKVDVEFQPVCTGPQPALERGHGVLGAKRAAATMGKDPRS
jgi:hypothetical protein